MPKRILHFNPQRHNVLDEVKAITGGKGVDKAIDCTGKAEAQLQALEAVRRDGKMAFLGENNRGLTIKPSDHFIRKNLDAISCWYFNSFEYADILRIVERNVPIQTLITHRFPLTEAQNAFETFASGKSAKVVLNPWA